MTHFASDDTLKHVTYIWTDRYKDIHIEADGHTTGITATTRDKNLVEDRRTKRETESQMGRGTDEQRETNMSASIQRAISAGNLTDRSKIDKQIHARVQMNKHREGHIHLQTDRRTNESSKRITLWSAGETNESHYEWLDTKGAT